MLKCILQIKTLKRYTKIVTETQISVVPLYVYVFWQPQDELADRRVEGWASITGAAKDFTDRGPARETQEREGAETVPV